MMDSYNSYDFNGGLFLSSHPSNLGNLDRLAPSSTNSSSRHYDIFSSFSRPRLPVSSDFLANSDDEENNSPVTTGSAPRLPLFRRCPLTNEAKMESFNSAGGKMKSSLSLSPLKNLSLNSPIKSRPANTNNGLSNNASRYGDYDPLGVLGGSRIPLLNLNNMINSNNSYEISPNNSFSSVNSSPTSSGSGNLSYLDSLSTNNNLPAKTTYSQMARKEPQAAEVFTSTSPARNNIQTSYVPPANPKPNKNGIVKLSLEDVKDDSLVALTNKHGKGKYWFKSGCPTPDPRWASCQQLMIGPIPGDVEYSTLRSAFLSKGHTIHLFIQNNQAWLEKNQEKFGKKQVKFGYVVYTDSAVSSRLLAQGYVMVGHAKVAVKEMDGQPAQFVN